MSTALVTLEYASWMRLIDSRVWVKESLRYRGGLLLGLAAHYCPDWDFMPIDEHCIEITCCSCADGAMPPIAERIAATRQHFEDQRRYLE